MVLPKMNGKNVECVIYLIILLVLILNVKVHNNRLKAGVGQTFAQQKKNNKYEYFITQYRKWHSIFFFKLIMCRPKNLSSYRSFGNVIRDPQFESFFPA